MAEQVLSARALNRALLARQLLLDRESEKLGARFHSLVRMRRREPSEYPP